MSVVIRGSVNTYGKFDIPTDLNGFVSIADFYRAHLDELMNTEVNDQIYHVGSGADAARPFNRAVEAFNPEGNQVTFGTEGDDFLEGNSGNNTLVGGSGDDTFVATFGDDIIYGGDGNDIVIISVEADSLRVSGDTVYHDESGSETTLVGVEQAQVGEEVVILL